MSLKRSGFQPPSKEKIAELNEKKRQKALAKAKLPKPLRKAPVASQRVSKTKRAKTQAQLKKELDAIFSKWIRAKYPAVCYTCGKVDTPLQCGHFVPRQYLSTRWHENNCRPQCVGCNIYGNGKPLDFEEHLKEELGEWYVENMKLSRHVTVKLDRNWYVGQINFYKEKLNELTLI